MTSGLTNPSMYGAYAKHRRAREHWWALCDELVAFVKAHVRLELGPGPGSSQKGMLWVTEPRESKLELLIGDCVQNLRSALDYLVWELAFVAEGRPTKHRTQFPIATSGKTYFEKAREGVAPLLGPHRRFIRKLQPYQGDKPLDHPLALLNRLSNRDKHRLLTFTVAHVGPISARPKEYAGGDLLVLPLFLKETPALQEILHYEPSLHAIAWVRFEFENENRLPVVETLSGLIDYVNLILDWFEPVVR